MKKANAFIAAALAASMLTSCGGTDTAEVTSAESTVSETTAAAVSETGTLSAESEETAAEAVNDSEVGDPYDVEEIPDETFIEEAESDDSVETSVFAEPPTPPEMADEFKYNGRSNLFTIGDYMSDFENALWMTVTNTYVSNDACELLFFENKEDAAVERMAYVGVEKAAGESTTLGIFRRIDDEFADDPMLSADYWAYKNHLLAVSGNDMLQYFPAGTDVPSAMVLFPDCGEFYYYGAATKEEYENNEYHWTKSTDLGLTWKPDSDSSTVGNFYYGSDPVVYTGVWSCGNTEIWIG